VDADLLRPLVTSPERGAVLLDVDGTLAPIVPRPELARVPEAARDELRRLIARYRLVACISGRTAAQARDLVGVQGIRYVGNHGLELHPDAAKAALAVARFRDEVAGTWPIEDKGLTFALHYREEPDEHAARAFLAQIAERAREAGLEPRWGRKVLEIRPRLPANKGTAIRALVQEADVDAALYAGDDATDVDAFEGLTSAGLRHAVRVAVSSPEAPMELLAAADLVVEGPPGLLELLRRL